MTIHKAISMYKQIFEDFEGAETQNAARSSTGRISAAGTLLQWI